VIRRKGKLIRNEAAQGFRGLKHEEKNRVACHQEMSRWGNNNDVSKGAELPMEKHETSSRKKGGPQDEASAGWIKDITESRRSASTYRRIRPAGVKLLTV